MRSFLLPDRSDRKGEWIAEHERLLDLFGAEVRGSVRDYQDPVISEVGE